jgi:hypothetical protein
METIHSSNFISIIHSPFYMEMIHSSDFMENIHPSYFMEIIHSSYLWILFLFSGTSPHPCAVHPLLRPVALAGPRRDGKGRRRIAAPVLRAQRSRKKRC